MKINNDKKMFILPPFEMKKSRFIHDEKIIDVISLNKRFCIIARENIIPIIHCTTFYALKKEYFMHIIKKMTRKEKAMQNFAENEEKIDKFIF